MAIWKNVASQKLAVFAYDSTDGSAKTGDASNITAQISLDGGATDATNDVNPTELDATDAPGIYLFDLEQAETNADLIVVAPVSATANILLDPAIIYTQTLNGSTLTAVPWNASWDAEVQSEVDDAIVANNLDHLCKTATASEDMTTEVVDNTILSRILANGDTSAFVPSTDGLQPIRDENVLEHDATQAAIGAIGVASGTGLNYEAEADNTGGAIKTVVFVGVQTSGTYASTESEDGTYHQIDDTGDAIDIIYQFDVTGIRKAVQAVWHGYVVGANDTITVQAYDYVGSDWETRGTIVGQAGTTNISKTFTLLSKHTGTGTDVGKVLLRFVCTGQSNPTLYTDSLLVEAAIANQSVGYAEGAIWVDTTVSNENTEPFVDGVADNPVSTWVAALSLSSSLGIKRFRIAGGSSITLTADSSNYKIYGAAYDLALGGQTITNAHIVGARVTGIGVNTGTAAVFEFCGMGAVTLGPSRLYQCGIGRSSGTFAAGSAGQFVIVDCFSLVPGSGTPTLTFNGTGSTTGVNIRRWAGGTNITLDSNCTLSLEVVAGGGQTITTGGASCEIRGTCRALTVVLSAAETVQFAGVTGPITLSGTTTATVNLYGVAGTLTNTTSAATVTNHTVSLPNVNVEVDNALNTAIPGGPTADSINERIATMDATVAKIETMIEEV